ncbi:MAG: agmatine deiminase family protein [Kiritimatiellae bacterium]|nr:agmatine deiminase family protein [Kiritimatiellia bacterium]
MVVCDSGADALGVGDAGGPAAPRGAGAGATARGDAAAGAELNDWPRWCRHPAEWEPHAATWLCWPHSRKDWPGKLAAVQWDFGEIVRRLVPSELVCIMVGSAQHERWVRPVLEAEGVPADRVAFHRIPSDRSWARDAGPIFVETERGLAIAHFAFTGWARYDDWQRDAAIPQRAADALGLPRFEPMYGGRRVVLEGGAFDVNGCGTVITTEQCLLDPVVQVRNPGFTRADYEAVFARWLGATTTIWLSRGIAGDDDTHGHVDDVCRFVNPTTLVLATEQNERDENYLPLRENAERLQEARLQDGQRPLVVPLPMPEPLTYQGRRLPASYLNFYIANEVVLVPTFNDPRDRLALGILADLFPDRTVVGIHAVDLLLGLGSVHCLTHEQPSIRPVSA